MASYTMELREYIEAWTQDNPSMSLRDRIEAGRTKLFDFDYPFFDEDYRKVFETHFIRKFYMTEIGFETESQFKFQLETWLQLNMDYYNKLFDSENLQYDVLNNMETNSTYNRKNNREQNDNKDITQTSTVDETSNTTIDKTLKTDQTGNETSSQTSKIDGTSNSTEKQTSTNHESGTKDSNGTRTDDNFNRKLFSDNPDSRLTITTSDGEGTIEYATNITENNENNKETTDSSVQTTSDSNGEIDSTNDTTSTVNTTGNSTSDTTININTTDNETNDKKATENKNLNQNDKLTSEINDTEDYVDHKVGKIGTITYPELVMKYRESLLRIENMIFAEMRKELFMLIY